MADTIEQRILAHSASEGVGLVKVVTNVQTKEVVHMLTPFAEEFTTEMRWRLTEEDGQFTLKIDCGAYDVIADDIARGDSAASGPISKFAVIWLTLSTIAALAPECLSTISCSLIVFNTIL
jgi:hypothetical protein